MKLTTTKQLSKLTAYGNTKMPKGYRRLNRRSAFECHSNDTSRWRQFGPSQLSRTGGWPALVLFSRVRPLGSTPLTPFLFVLWQAHPQTIQFAGFISHLTNSNECDIVNARVLPPQPRVCSRNRLLLPSSAPRSVNISPILSALRILPVATGVHYPLQRPQRSGIQALGSTNSFACKRLPPLSPLFSLRCFRRSLPLFSIVCSLFCENTRGGGGFPSLYRR